MASAYLSYTLKHCLEQVTVVKTATNNSLTGPAIIASPRAAVWLPWDHEAKAGIFRLYRPVLMACLTNKP